MIEIWKLLKNSGMCFRQNLILCSKSLIKFTGKIMNTISEGKIQCHVLTKFVCHQILQIRCLKQDQTFYSNKLMRDVHLVVEYLKFFRQEIMFLNHLAHSVFVGSVGWCYEIQHCYDYSNVREFFIIILVTQSAKFLLSPKASVWNVFDFFPVILIT